MNMSKHLASLSLCLLKSDRSRPPEPSRPQDRPTRVSATASWSPSSPGGVREKTRRCDLPPERCSVGGPLASRCQDRKGRRKREAAWPLLVNGGPRT